MSGVPRLVWVTFVWTALFMEVHSQECFSWQWKCDNGECILDIFKCDGYTDCTDNSDELATMCSNQPCDDYELECTGNKEAGVGPFCASTFYLCDGIVDCTEKGEDEMGCGTTTTESPRNGNCSGFLCKDDGSCIDSSFVCNHRSDCFRGEDEKNCTYPNCTADQFMCASGQCIFSTGVCDGKSQCHDLSDENVNMCVVTPAPICNAMIEYTCNNSKCIAGAKVCNSVDDCGDNSDESNCGANFLVNECLDAMLNQCVGTCVDTLWGYYCTCSPGNRLAYDGYNCTAINECVEPPFMCSQNCVDKPNGADCSCTPGYKVATSDPNKCVSADGTTGYILFANLFYIRNLTLSGSQLSHVTDHHISTQILDYDLTDGKIYYVDSGQYQIRRMDFDGGNDEVVNQHYTYSVEGVAIDWIGKKLYWTSYALQGIYVAEVNGTRVKGLIKQHSELPRGIVVHPYKGYIYWTDWSNQPHIGRAGLDGSNVTKIVESGVYWPNGITIDYATNRLYWVDAFYDQIELSDLNGHNRQVVVPYVAHGFSLTLFEDSIYFAEWNNKKVFKHSKYPEGNKTLLLETIHRPFDLHVVHPLRQPIHPNPCGNSNGGCSHLCLISAGGESFTCHCPEHFVMQSDGKTCNASCTTEQFECGGNDHKCIPLIWFCDGEVDCAGGEDEPANHTQCQTRWCPPGLFQCTDNQWCTYPSFICDGYKDCLDNSDEHDCGNRTCLPYQFRCDSGQCIGASRVCDGEPDCYDDSDETQAICEAQVCNEITEFKCNNSKCIPKSWFCNWDDDCGDNSDEPTEYCWNNFTCPPGKDRCRTNHRCISVSLYCDGDDDCRDGSDEDPARCPKCDPASDFTCASGECIPNRWECNGFENCDDGSDEHEKCEPRACSEAEFRCNDGLCIRGGYKCDFTDDCKDKSDEDPAMCRNSTHECDTGQIKCSSSGYCIDERFKCDGYPDCPGDYPSDESADCTHTCPSDMFTCANKVCIDDYYICDGDNDCGDYSDETAAECAKIPCDSIFRFSCQKSKKCIFITKLCNGKDDCGDGDTSDEDPATTCHPETPVCTRDQLNCNSTFLKCVNLDNVCDGVDNCGNSNDEQRCHVSNLTCATASCEQLCRNTSLGYHCSCEDGFLADPDHHTKCLDVDECSAWEYNTYCPHRCVNDHGSYVCQCHAGFQDVYWNGTLCTPRSNQSESILLSQLNEIRQLDEGSGTYLDAVMSGRRIETLDTDIVSKVVYWADTSLTAIRRARLPNHPSDLGIAQDILGPDPKLAHVTGLAYDWIGKNVYWTSSEGTISVMTDQGYYLKTLIGGGNGTIEPAHIVVNSNLGVMFWIDKNPKDLKIERSLMSGKDRQVIVSGDMDELAGLAIDYYLDRLYWTDVKKSTIESCDLMGGDRVVVTKDLASEPYSIDVFGGYLFWTSLVDDRLYKMDKFGRTQPMEVLHGLTLPRDLKIYHPSRYDTQAFVSNPCLTAMGTPVCDALCVPEPGGQHQCLCPDGKDLRGALEGVCVTMTPPAPLRLPDLCTCNLHGYCEIVTGATPQCNCDSGYTGRQCENKITTTVTTPSTTVATQPSTTVAAPTSTRVSAPPSSTVSPSTTTTLPEVKPAGQTGGPGDKVGIVIGVIVLVMVAIVILVVIAFFLHRSGRLKRSRANDYRANPIGLQHSYVESADKDDPMGGAISFEENGDVKFSNPMYDVVGGPRSGGPHGEADNGVSETTGYQVFPDTLVLTDQKLEVPVSNNNELKPTYNKIDSIDM